MNIEDKASHLAKFDYARVCAFGLILATSLVVCSALLGSGQCLLTTDDNIGMVAAGKRLLPHGFLGCWDDASLVGSARSQLPVAWVNVLMTLTPAAWFTNMIHSVDLLVASGFLMVFLRRLRLSWVAAAMGALVAFWIGSNFTLIYAGHTAKFGVLMFSTASLWAIDHAVRDRQRLSWSLVAGGLVGFMFQEQVDQALFFGLFLGGYAIFRLWTKYDATWMRGLGTLLPMGAVAILISGAALMAGYFNNVVGVASMSPENPQAKWEYVTQWSLPPGESIAMIAPGYVGWRSGEPEGPYWGSMGRSAEWEKTRQGFMNFKLDDWYVGAIPVIIGIAAFVFAMRKDWFMGEQSYDTRIRAGEGDDLEVMRECRGNILFFSGVVVVALLLSFGKFSILYALFYKLPFVNNIRAPVKLLQVAQLALGVLAAFGIDEVLSRRTMLLKGRRV